MTKFLAKSFSVSYDTNQPGFVVLRKEQGQWRIQKTLFEYQVKQFKEANRAEIEKGTIRIQKQ